MRLLLVEDDQNLGQATQQGLRRHHAVDWVRTAEEAEAALSTTQYALIILDINLPGKSGLELLQDRRKRHDTTPVLLLTARDAVEYRIEGLDAGADDYLIKPFDLDELIARCSALIRRSTGQISPMLEHRGLHYDSSNGYLEKDGQSVMLSARELAIFDLLIRNVGRPVSREKIMENVYDWASDDIESNTIEVHVASLRRKLGRDLIRTLRGIGYTMEA